MFCTNCGKEVEDTWIKCPYCGTIVERDENVEHDTHSEIHNDPAGNEQYEKPVSEHIPEYQIGNTDKIRYRSFWKFLLLSCITFGIYGIYVMYGYVKDLNKVCEGDGKQSKNYIVVILLSMVTCGIYGLYWYYTQGERLYLIAPKYGIQIREKGSTILLWSLLGVVTFGISSMAVTYIMFDNMNLIGKIYNGEKTAEEISRSGKPHPHLLRNVLIICVVFWVLILGSVFWIVKMLFTYDASVASDYDVITAEDDTAMPGEMTEDYSGIDLETYFGQPEEMLKELGIEGDEEYGEYMALDGAVYISCTDGTADIIMLEGVNENMPAFHGVKTGMSLSEAAPLLSDTYMSAGQMDDQYAYLDADTGTNIVLETSGEEITRITVMQMSQDEIDSYMQEAYIFPDSDKKYLSEDEVRSVEADRLAIGRNEIFARHGYIFSEDTYKQYFESMPWYKGTVPADQFNADEVFNDFEKKNVELIKKVEDEVNGVTSDANSASGVDFIGISGSYQCGSDPESGVIDVAVQGNEISIAIGTHAMPGFIGGVGGGIQGEIVDSNTAVVDYGAGCVFTLKWSDTGVFTITRSATSGYDEIDEITNGIEYVNAQYYGVS